MPKEVDGDFDMFEKWAEDCAVKERATRDDIDDVLAFILPTTPAGKCLNACLGEKLGIVSSRINQNLDNIYSLVAFLDEKQQA